MRVITEFKLLGYDLALQSNNIRFVYSGEGKPDRDKVRPLIEEVKRSKALIVKELKKELCQYCLSRKWKRLCWGNHADGRKGFGRFCLECEPYPYDMYPEMLRGGEKHQSLQDLNKTISEVKAETDKLRLQIDKEE